jgi:Lipase (class 3)
MFIDNFQEKFNINNAVNYAYIAEASYYAFYYPDLFEQTIAQSGYNITNIEQFYDEPGEIMGFVGDLSQDTLIISFTGTQPLFIPETVWDDLFIEHTKFGGGWVSKGFYKAWNDIKNFILARLPIKNVIIIGHSLGAAIATLASYYIKDTYPSTEVIIYTYASPRVGDTAFAKSFNDKNIKSYRVQNYWDIVPRLPIKDLGYHHIHTLILIERMSDGKVKCTYNAKAPTNVLKDPLDWPHEHSISTYIDLLKTV